MRHMTRRIAALLISLLLIGSLAPAALADGDCPPLEANIAEINKYGNIILSITADSMEELGYEPGDLLRVTIGDAAWEIPIGTAYSDADAGEPICCYKTRADGLRLVVLAVNAGDLATEMGVATKRSISAAPGFEWIYPDGEAPSVLIEMAEKQGYAEEYALHRLGSTRSNKRADYAELSDAEYANFREVATTGMGEGMLYRSSSPIRPNLNRAAEADEALFTALVSTVMNMADSELSMRAYPDFEATHYADCAVIALDMGMDPQTPEFRAKLAEGFRFLAANPGPYLIHCNEGKDRTGFAAAVLECLMGADADELDEDYLLSYYNFYGIEPDSEQGKTIAATSLEAALCEAFGLADLRAPGTDLSESAARYLSRIGLNENEIAALRQSLAEDYGGLLASAPADKAA